MPREEKKHLIVDGQILQSDARHRGIGRYSENLLLTILGDNPYQSVTIILSKKTHTLDTKEEALHDGFADAKIVYLDLKNTTKGEVEDVTVSNKNIVDKYVEGLNVDPGKIDYLVLAPFQEPIVSIFPSDVNKFLVVYDLIPYLYSEQYSQEMQFDNYLKRFGLLFEADKLLPISNAVGEDLALYLGIPNDKIHPIYGAPVITNKEEQSSRVLPPGKYILMPTGDDIRKNNLRAAMGFEEFNTRSKTKYKLVVTSKINKSEKMRLKKVSKNVVFTGSVNGATLDKLYSESNAVLFVPESEGLGLPVLEGLGHGKSVVCSNIDVFREINSSALVFCDHTRPSDIASALQVAVNKKIDDRVLVENKKVLDFFSWSRTATRTTEAMLSTVSPSPLKKPRIAVFTPAPNGLSAIGKVVAESHATLTRYFDIDYFAESGPIGKDTRPNYLQYLANYYDASYFSVAKYSEYDAVFYHIGNSEYHLESIANSLYMPGYVIIHDTNVSDAFKVMTERGMISRDRADLEAHMTNLGKIALSNHLVSIGTGQVGIITHSKYAMRALQEITGKGKYNIKSVNLPTYTPKIQPQRSRTKLVFGLAGIIADIKGTEVIESLAKDERYSEHKLSIFGYNYSPTSTINRLRRYNNVAVETNVTDLDFVDKMRQLDVFVNYRMKYQGETSLSTLEAMRQGVVVIVRNVGWYSELPDDAVVKVDTMDDVAEKLNYLVDNLDILEQISRRAAEYVKNRHGHDDYAKGMLEVIRIGTTTNGHNRHVADALKSGKIGSKADLGAIQGV